MKKGKMYISNPKCIASSFLQIRIQCSVGSTALRSKCDPVSVNKVLIEISKLHSEYFSVVNWLFFFFFLKTHNYLVHCSRQSQGQYPAS